MRILASSPPLSTSFAVSGITALVVVTVACLYGPQLGAEETAKKKAGEASTVEKSPPSPIPKIPKDKLPPATGNKPDPKKEQYKRGTVFVSVEEFVDPESGVAYEPKVPLLQVYLSEYFRRAGFDVANALAAADFSVVGFFEAAYVRTLAFKNQRFALQFKGSAGVEVKDATGRVLGKIDVPEQLREAALMAPLPKSAGKKAGSAPPAEEGDAKQAKPPSKGPPSKKADVKDTRVRRDAAEGDASDPSPLKKAGDATPATKQAQEAELIRDFRREFAKIIWNNVFQELRPIADAEIPPLIESLTVDDFEALEPVDGNAVVSRLIQRRFDAVPYLLDAMSDERPVLVETKYPGLTPLNAEKLRVFHLADKALENIFQKVSRLNLDSPPEHRFIIIKAWEYEWRRFCKSYKDSPSAPPRKPTPKPTQKKRP